MHKGVSKYIERQVINTIFQIEVIRTQDRGCDAFRNYALGSLLKT